MGIAPGPDTFTADRSVPWVQSDIRQGNTGIPFVLYTINQKEKSTRWIKKSILKG
ncbi:hypothetical protein HMPREF1141_3341 [Clostridium sp. MSTE9]|nr:hypothetical protein HMPREF1141_3341 [Clostridium sp. MSTE9]